ncbi:hypothetical protein LVB87_11525 [Lysobacter sp. KIS68-7]|uniref:hypothetical protein n=1 Tax=Lysobacter sp. KIS68-7 TaxID=2904252 RepID=UPI001E5A69BB|nr:hypothetical protein [Lysobacter sp. KIS68-7]UHQ18811.1 hypothetical protein LVB87_11525 [Lysobacter sp. KIS68-7]
MGIVEFMTQWEQLAKRLERLFGDSTSSLSHHPVMKWLHGARDAYLSGERVQGCARAAFAQFAVEDLERILAHDENLFRHFKKALRRDRSATAYFGIRQEIRMAASLITKGIDFNKSEAPDFTLGELGLECTSAHLVKGAPTNRSLAYKLASAIAKKSQTAYSTRLNVLAIDMSNLLFHEGVGSTTNTLSWTEELQASLQEGVNRSPFQAVLCFAYAWVQAGPAGGATLSNYYSRVDRDEMDSLPKAFLDNHFPSGSIWVYAQLQKHV